MSEDGAVFAAEGTALGAMTEGATGSVAHPLRNPTARPAPIVNTATNEREKKISDNATSTSSTRRERALNRICKRLVNRI
jgi:hypothetical protein